MKTEFLFTIGIMFFLIISSCKNDKAKVRTDLSCIEYILTQDDSLGAIRNYACEKMPLSQTVIEYVKDVSNLDFEDCPEAFSEAFQEHMTAWLGVIPIMEKYPDLRGEMHTLFEQIEKGEDRDSFKVLVDKIWSTWADVEKAKIAD